VELHSLVGRRAAGSGGRERRSDQRERERWGNPGSEEREIEGIKGRWA
jgi:hypothetical protein